MTNTFVFSMSSVLLFSPLPSRLRYLTHKAVEDRPELTAFSVGEGFHRRVVVCHCELRYRRGPRQGHHFWTVLDLKMWKCGLFLCRGEVEEDRKAMENSDEHKYSILSRNRASKRPDKPLYMPRAVRQRLSLQNACKSAANEESCPPSSGVSSSSESRSYCDTTDATNPSSTCRQGSQPSAVDSILSLTAEMSIQCPLEGDQVRDQSVSCFSDVTLDSYEKDREHDATVPCNGQTEDSTLDATDLSEEVSKDILYFILIVLFFFLQILCNTQILI